MPREHIVGEVRSRYATIRTYIDYGCTTVVRDGQIDRTMNFTTKFVARQRMIHCDVQTTLHGLGSYSYSFGCGERSSYFIASNGEVEIYEGITMAAASGVTRGSSNTIASLLLSSVSDRNGLDWAEGSAVVYEDALALLHYEVNSGGNEWLAIDRESSLIVGRVFRGEREVVTERRHCIDVDRPLVIEPILSTEDFT